MQSYPFKLTVSLMLLLVFSACTSRKVSTGTKLAEPVKASRILDLSHPMSEEMPYWPGGVPFKMDRLVDYDHGYRLHKYSMGENVGTHVDAPAHFIKDKRSIADIPLSSLVVPIARIDVSSKVIKNQDYQLSIEDLNAWEKEYGSIPKNALVVLDTGWHKKFTNPKEYINLDDQDIMHFPGYGPEVAKLLAKREIAGIGIDTLSLDYGPSKTFDTHVAMLKANKYQIENMANLSALPPLGATAVIGVLPVKGGTQAQARIYALLP